MDQHLHAIDLALQGQWDAAHRIVQRQDDKVAAWIHAVLHKIEGDPGNAAYWYRIAGTSESETLDAHQELVKIRDRIQGSLTVGE